VFVYDRLKATGQSSPAGTGAFNTIHAVGDSVIAMHDRCTTNCQLSAPGSYMWEASLWTRASQQVVSLVHPASAAVPEACRRSSQTA
jgi:hypothetical protein